VKNPKALQVYLEALDDLIITCHGPLTQMIYGVSVDSRQVKQGWIFCAIAGSCDNGAKYVADAINAGAVVIISQELLELPEDIVLIQVSDSYTTAARLAEEYYDFPAKKLNLIGITGTNGKTTSAFLLYSILLQNRQKVGMIGTVQYSFGDINIEADRTTPPAFMFQELLAKMVATKTDTVVLENSSHALVQRRMGTAPFEVAIYTNLTGDHLDYHENFENYYQAKKILFTEYLLPNCPAVINIDDEYGKRLYEELKSSDRPYKLIAYGQKMGAEARISELATGFKGSSFDLCFEGKTIHIISPLIGYHNIYNLAGVVATALALAVPHEVICSALLGCEGAPGRLQPIHADKGFVIFVDYAHTDDALKNVLSALRKLEPKRLFVIFGCGGDRDRSKRPRMAKVASELADVVIVTSDNPRTEDMQAIIDEITTGIVAGTNFRCFVERAEAIQVAVSEAEEGDIILLAGKGHETYQEINGVKHDFDDVCEVKKALATIGSL